MEKIEKFLQPENNASFVLQFIKNLVSRLHEILGLIVIDKKKSFFKIPFPIQLPIAIVASLPDLVQFHVKGIEQILAASYEV